MAYDNSVPFSLTKNGIFYFERRVPTDLLKHYDTRKISYSLRTRSVRIAEARARRAADQLDGYWYHLRSKDADLPGKHRLRMRAAPNGAAPEAPLSDSVTLSEAVSVYLKQKGHGRPVTFHRAAERSCGYVIDVAGAKDLWAYTNKDANAFRDALIKRGLSGSSMTRIFGTVRSVTNIAACELGVSFTNPFSGVYFDKQAGVQECEPLSVDAVKRVQAECLGIDDVKWSHVFGQACSVSKVYRV
ncbi:DUF6538 domain-containing protein [Jannaschia sp. 2305UL9-9]|uniref:DUF6538 domain-containing protein n=1 Tax=Jannaschia sp. 2305UL9-9 TaxID=3121638 RepID=UPI0035281F96